MKIHVTVEERLLLHLLEFKRFEDKYNVPIALSQEGIAEAISIRRNDVSRTIKSIMEKGWVDVTLGHVKGILRRRKIYFLTPEGFTNAQRIKDSLMEVTILVKVGDANREMKLKEINPFFETSYTIIQLIKIINTLGYFEAVPSEEIDNLTPAGKASSKESSKGPVHVFENPPQEAKLVGRTKEMKAARKVVAKNGILTIRGLAGIGKSSFSFKLLKSHEATHDIFWFRIRQFDSVKKVLSSMSDFFKKSGHENLEQYLSKVQEVDLNIVGDILRECFEKDRKYVIAFDDVQKSTSALIQFFNLLVEMKDAMPQVTFIFIGRHLPKFYDRRQVVVEKRITEISIEGLDRISSMELIKKHGLSEEQFAHVYQITQGHPLALELYEKEADKDELVDINQFLTQEVFGNLEDSERRILECISIFREPVPVGEVLVQEGIDYGSIDRLVYRSIIFEVKYGYYDMHDLLKKAVNKRMGPKEKAHFHMMAAEYYSHVDGIHARLEEIHHYLEGGDMEKALEKVLTHSTLLQENKFSLELVSAIERIKKEIEPKRLTQVRDNLDDICVRVRDLWGRWDVVFEHIFQHIMLYKVAEDRPMCKPYTSAPLANQLPILNGICEKASGMDLASWTFPPLKKPQRMLILKSYEDVVRSEEEWEQAMKDQALSIETLRRVGDHAGAVSMQVELGWLHWRLGDMKSSMEVYEEAIKEAESHGISRITAKIYLNMGLVRWTEGDLDSSVELFDMAIQHHINREILIQLMNMKAAVLLEDGKSEEALELFQDAMEASNDIGLYTMYAYSTLHMIQTQIIMEIRKYPYLGPDKETERKIMEALVETLPKLRDCRTMFDSIFDRDGYSWADAMVRSLEGLLEDVSDQAG